MEKRRKYTDELKAEALKMVINRKSVASITLIEAAGYLQKEVFP